MFLLTHIISYVFGHVFHHVFSHIISSSMFLCHVFLYHLNHHQGYDLWCGTGFEFLTPGASGERSIQVMLEESQRRKEEEAKGLYLGLTWMSCWKLGSMVNGSMGYFTYKWGMNWGYNLPIV